MCANVTYCLDRTERTINVTLVGTERVKQFLVRDATYRRRAAYVGSWFLVASVVNKLSPETSPYKEMAPFSLRWHT
jgi:hypothetical protein